VWGKLQPWFYWNCSSIVIKMQHLANYWNSFFQPKYQNNYPWCKQQPKTTIKFVVILAWRLMWWKGWRERSSISGRNWNIPISRTRHRWSLVWHTTRRGTITSMTSRHNMRPFMEVFVPLWDLYLFGRGFLKASFSQICFKSWIFPQNLRILVPELGSFCIIFP